MNMAAIDDVRHRVRESGIDFAQAVLSIGSAAALGVWFGIEYARRAIFIESHGVESAALFAPARWMDHPINAPVPAADTAFYLAVGGLLVLGAVGWATKRYEE